VLSDALPAILHEWFHIYELLEKHILSKLERIGKREGASVKVTICKSLLKLK
jgi:hypothetical protein